MRGRPLLYNENETKTEVEQSFLFLKCIKDSGTSVLKAIHKFLKHEAFQRLSVVVEEFRYREIS